MDGVCVARESDDDVDENRGKQGKGKSHHEETVAAGLNYGLDSMVCMCACVGP